MCVDAVDGKQGRQIMLKDPEKWSVDDVCQWIREIGLEQYCDVFKQQDIDGAELLTLNHDTLFTALNIGKNMV